MKVVVSANFLSFILRLKNCLWHKPFGTAVSPWKSQNSTQCLAVSASVYKIGTDRKQSIPAFFKCPLEAELWGRLLEANAAFLWCCITDKLKTRNRAAGSIYLNVVAEYANIEKKKKEPQRGNDLPCFLCNLVTPEAKAKTPRKPWKESRVTTYTEASNSY